LAPRSPTEPEQVPGPTSPHRHGRDEGDSGRTSPREPIERAAEAASYVGIAVSTAPLDVAPRPAQPAERYPHEAAGIAELVDRLRPLSPQLVVLEATGGLQRLVVAALALATLPVAVVTPPQVRDCARAAGHVAKTAAVEAAVVAHFAAALHPPPRPLPDAQQQALAALARATPAPGGQADRREAALAAGPARRAGQGRRPHGLAGASRARAGRRTGPDAARQSAVARTRPPPARDGRGWGRPSR